MRRSTHHDRPSRREVLGSVALHVVVLAGAAFATTAPELPAMPPTVRVRLVAAAPEDAPVRQDPSPPEVAEEEHRPPPPDPTPDPVPQTETPKVEAEVPVEREPEPEPARTEEVGEEAVNVQIEGANTQFPEYFDDIIRQVQRYWRPPAGARDLRAEISFVIHRDGSVDGIEWVRKSGSSVFDLRARSAIETAARQRAFGPLPELYPADAMRVSFFFDPTTR